MTTASSPARRPTVRLTRAQAEALNILEQANYGKPRRRRTRQTAAGPYATVCHYCAETFTTRAAEDRHVKDTRHGRYDLIYEIEQPT